MLHRSVFLRILRRRIANFALSRGARCLAVRLPITHAIGWRILLTQCAPSLLFCPGCRARCHLNARGTRRPSLPQNCLVGRYRPGITAFCSCSVLEQIFKTRNHAPRLRGKTLAYNKVCSANMLPNYSHSILNERTWWDGTPLDTLGFLCAIPYKVQVWNMEHSVPGVHPSRTIRTSPYACLPGLLNSQPFCFILPPIASFHVSSLERNAFLTS